jgi:hypothetical protein
MHCEVKFILKLFLIIIKNNYLLYLFIIFII